MMKLRWIYSDNVTHRRVEGEEHRAKGKARSSALFSKLSASPSLFHFYSFLRRHFISNLNFNEINALSKTLSFLLTLVQKCNLLTLLPYYLICGLIDGIIR